MIAQAKSYVICFVLDTMHTLLELVSAVQDSSKQTGGRKSTNTPSIAPKCYPKREVPLSESVMVQSVSSMKASTKSAVGMNKKDAQQEGQLQ